MSAALVLPDSGGLRVLVLGVSTRAMVESAVYAGYIVTSLDYFADSDMPAEVQAYALNDFGRRPTLRGLAEEAGKLTSQVDAVAFAAGVENEPRLARAAPDLLRLGNRAEVIRRVRSKLEVWSAL
jgi:predicted ATP-grasp superfamily ATP-dependent carboligase